MEKLKSILGKRIAVVALFGLFAVGTLASCQREGCPGQITKAPVETEQSC